MSIIGQTLVRNNITVATANVPDDEKLFKIVCYMLIREVAASHRQPFLIYIKGAPGANSLLPPSTLGSIFVKIHRDNSD